MVTEEERQWMWREYAPEPRMRLNLGIRRRLAPLLDNDRRKTALANSLLFTLPGSPILYYGDEIGMGDNIWLDDRNGVRTPMQWTSGPTPGFGAPSERLYSHRSRTGLRFPAGQCCRPTARPGSLLNQVKGLIAVHKQHPALGAGIEWAEAATNPAVLAFYRSGRREILLFTI